MLPVSRPTSQHPELRQPVDGHGQPGAGVPEVQLHPPVGRAGEQPGVGPFGQQHQHLRQRARPDEVALGAGDVGAPARAGRGARAARRGRRPRPGRPRRRRRRGSAGSRCTGRGSRSGRAGRTRWVRARGRPGARRAVGVGRPAGGGRRGRTPPPSSRRSPGCSSRTASPRGRPSPAAPGAGRPARPSPSAVTTSWPSSAAAGTRQAFSAVQRLRFAVGPQHQHRAGAALPLGASLLAAGQAVGAQPLQQGDVPADVTDRPEPTVDEDRRAPRALRAHGAR